MLKITPIQSGARSQTLRLEGRIVGPWVAELQRSCDEVLGLGRSLHLHLADVEFMDAPAVELLNNLQRGGVGFLECPPFAAEQLRMAGKP